MFQSAVGRILESDWFLFNYEFKFTIFFFVLLNTVFLMLITLSQEPSLSLSSGTDIDTLKSKSGTSLFRVHFDGAHPKRVCKECRLSLRTKSIEAISLRSRTFGWKCYLTINIKRAWSESLVRKRDARVIFSLLSSFSVSLNGALRKLGGVENWKRGQLLCVHSCYHLLRAEGSQCLDNCERGLRAKRCQPYVLNVPLAVFVEIC